MGLRAADVDDAVQDALVALHKGLDGYDPGRSRAVLGGRGEGGAEGRAYTEEERRAAARGLVLVIAVRRAHRYRRWARRAEELPVRQGGAWFERAEDDETPEMRLAAAEREALAMRLLDAVKPGRREALVLRDAFDVPIKEIAAALGINVNTVKTRLRRAREEYRAAARRLSAEERLALRPGLLSLLPAPALLLRAVGREPGAPRAPGGGTAGGRTTEGAGKARHPRPRGAMDAGDALRQQIGKALLVAGTLMGPATPGDAAAPATWAARGLAAALRAEADFHACDSARPGSGSAEGAASEDAASSAAASDPPASAEAEAARQHAPIRPGNRRGATTPGAMSDEDALAAERALLTGALTALSQGAPEMALAAIRAHARRFPEGVLAETREALRARALRRRDAASIATDGEPARPERALSPGGRAP